MSVEEPATLRGCRLLGLELSSARVPPFLMTPSRWRPATPLPRRPVLLDVCCGRGGAGVGYYAAGFDVVGVDLVAQQRYPFEFYRRDGIGFVSAYGDLFDAIHVSPPCQCYSRLASLATGEYPRLIAGFRRACQRTGRPYVIENVEGARSEMQDPVTLCMATWSRRLYRHRLFESTVALLTPPHPTHDRPQAKMGRPAKPEENYQAVGNFPQIREVRHQMEMPWSDRRGIAESVPPVFTDYLGRQLIAHIVDDAAGLAA